MKTYRLTITSSGGGKRRSKRKKRKTKGRSKREDVEQVDMAYKGLVALNLPKPSPRHNP